tara:strand:- start:39 stop:233 length:195 start_codon:yes stop_codon:yes gene_type:complete
MYFLKVNGTKILQFTQAGKPFWEYVESDDPDVAITIVIYKEPKKNLAEIDKEMYANKMTVDSTA